METIVSSSIYHEVMGLDAMILVFWMLSFKPTFSLSSFTFIKRLFSSSLSAIRVVSSAYLVSPITQLVCVCIHTFIYWFPNIIFIKNSYLYYVFMSIMIFLEFGKYSLPWILLKTWRNISHKSYFCSHFLKNLCLWVNSSEERSTILP